MVLSRRAPPGTPPALKLRIPARTRGMVVTGRVGPASTATGVGLYCWLGKEGWGGGRVEGGVSLEKRGFSRDPHCAYLMASTHSDINGMDREHRDMVERRVRRTRSVELKG